LEWVDQHEKWNKECIYKEHDRLLLNDTKFMCIKIMKSNRFNGQGHQGSCEKQTQCVLEGK